MSAFIQKQYNRKNKKTKFKKYLTKNSKPKIKLSLSNPSKELELSYPVELLLSEIIPSSKQKSKMVITLLSKIHFSKLLRKNKSWLFLVISLSYLNSLLLKKSLLSPILKYRKNLKSKKVKILEKSTKRSFKKLRRPNK